VAKIVIKYYSKEGFIEGKATFNNGKNALVFLAGRSPDRETLKIGAKQCQSLNLDALNAVTCSRSCFSIQMKKWI
jgi:hypothetical protein